MKIKLLKSNFDPASHISSATIATPYGNFTDSVKTAEDDLVYESKIRGCNYAMAKACIKAFKMRARIHQAKYEALKSLNYQLTTFNEKKLEDMSGLEVYQIVCQQFLIAENQLKKSQADVQKMIGVYKNAPKEDVKAIKGLHSLLKDKKISLEEKIKKLNKE